MAFKHDPGGDTLHAGKVEVTGRIVHETDKAVLLDDGVTTQWLPRSKVDVEPISEQFVEVFMPEWLAKEKGYV